MFPVRPRLLLFILLFGVTCSILLLSPLFAIAQAPSFVLTAAGDYGGNTNTDAVLTGISNAGASFNLALGDLSYGSYSPETAWCAYVQSKVGATFPF